MSMGFVRISVDGLLLTGSASDSCLWIVEDVEGWHQGPGWDVTQSQRTTHGQFAVRGRRTGRQIILTGHVVAEVRRDVELASKRLASLLADGGFGELIIEDADGETLWADVQVLDSRVRWPSGLFLDYQLTLLAPDAYRYGARSSSSTPFESDPEGVGLVEPIFGADGVMDFGVVPMADGTATVTNAGTAAACPVFSVAGPSPVGGFSIVDVGSGERIQFLGDVPADSTLVIDCRDGSVRLDGTADRAGEVIVSSWPTVPKGSSATYRFAAETTASAAVLSVDLISTYW